MARISNAEKARRAEQLQRVEKAHASIMEQVSRLLTKHLPVLAGERTHSVAKMEIHLAEGNAEIRFSYQTEITDASRFKLDDGQSELPLTPE